MLFVHGFGPEKSSSPGRYYVYDFPSYRLIRNFADRDLPEAGAYGEACFAGEDHLVMAHWGRYAHQPDAIYLIDIRGEKPKAERISRFSLDGFTYLPKNPGWNMAPYER